MIIPFEAEGDACVVRIDGTHARLLAQLVGEVLALLDEPTDLSFVVAAILGPEDDRPAPEVPVLERLLPAMSADPEEAAALRALTEDILRTEKSKRLREVAAALETPGPVRLAGDEAWTWLAAINDLRLVLSVVLGIENSADAEGVSRRAEADDDTHDTFVARIYEVLSWWQDSLLRAMRGESPEQ